MKKATHYIVTALTVFVFGYLLLHSNDTLAVSQPIKKESTKEISLHFNQGKIDFNKEGTQKESISLKTNQNYSGSSEIVFVENIESAREIATGSEAGDVILVKGSRAEGLEKLAELLIGDINDLPSEKSEG